MKSATLLLLAALLSLTATSSHAQTPYEESKVEIVDGVPAEELYRRAKKWFVDTFRDASSVIQLDDPATQTIIGKGALKYTPSIFMGSAARKGFIGFSIEVAAREGRYRIRLYDFNHTGSITEYSSTTFDLGVIYAGDTCSMVWGDKQSKHRYRVCNEEVWPHISANNAAILQSLEKAMAVPSNAGASDW